MIRAIRPPTSRPPPTTKKPATTRRQRASYAAWWREWTKATAAAAHRAQSSSAQQAARRPARTEAKTARQKKATTQAHKAAPRSLQVSFEPLLVVEGKDGFLRGLPDPTLVLCAFAIDSAGHVRTALKGVVRFAVAGRAPAHAPPSVSALASTSLAPTDIVVLVAALFEENGGADIRALAAALEDHGGVSVVDIGGGVPVVHSLVEAAAVDVNAGMVARGILCGRRDPSRTTSDQWVGGALLVLAGGKKQRAWRAHRVALRSADGRQDWVLSLRTRRD